MDADRIVESMTAQRDQVWAMLLAGEVEARIATEWLDPLNDAAERFDINTRLRLVHWLATLIHESAGFERLEENLSYSAKRLFELFPLTPRREWGFTAQEAAEYARKPEKIANRIYADRMGNGNEASGEGWAFRGRGCIQLTGRYNYEKAGDAIEVDLINDPDALLDPVTGALVAGWFWQSHGNELHRGIGCNELADRDDTTAIRKRINGGGIGLIDVSVLVARLKLA